MRKKNEIPNGTIHREATCHAEERKTKDDRRKEEGQRVDFWSNQCGTGSFVVARTYSVQTKCTTHATLDSCFGNKMVGVLGSILWRV